MAKGKLTRGKRQPARARYKAESHDKKNQDKRAKAQKAFKARKDSDGHTPRGAKRRLVRAVAGGSHKPLPA